MDKELRKDYLLTLDIDWAPEVALDFCFDALVKIGVKATWFITHDSKINRKIAQFSNLFEAGVHPNCLPGSTHGSNEDDVLFHCRQMVTEAVSMRTHGLYQNSKFLIKAAKDYNFVIDSSIFLPYTPYIQPHIFRNKQTSVYRFPLFFSDFTHIYSNNGSWDLESVANYDTPGLKIFNFHPIHIYLNTYDISQYQDYQNDKHRMGSLSDHVNSSRRGIRDLFFDYIGFLKERRNPIYTLREYANIIFGLRENVK